MKIDRYGQAKILTPEEIQLFLLLVANNPGSEESLLLVGGDLIAGSYTYLPVHVGEGS